MKWSVRHRWQQYGNKLHHMKRCEKCGCMKNEKTIGRTVYTLNGVEYIDDAPDCPNTFLNQKQKEETNEI